MGFGVWKSRSPFSVGNDIIRIKELRDSIDYVLVLSQKAENMRV